MTAIIGCSEWGRELCRAFGEDPKGVRAITLRSEPNVIVTVTIEKFVDKDNTKILETIKKVAWVEDESEEEKI